MCKVLQYTFECGHHLQLRKSRCRGKFVKGIGSRTKAACCSAAYLVTKLHLDCGECQQTGWETSWRIKLERANEFLAHLVKTGLPGAQEISEQVNRMEQEHDQDAWTIRQKFPPVRKIPIERVKLRSRAPRESHLREEVRPEDVVVLGPILDDTDYDDSGSDCIYNYSHPLDGADSSWVDEFLSQEGTELPESTDNDYELGSNAWNWNENSASDAWAYSNGGSNTASAYNDTSSMPAWSPNAEPSSSPGVFGLECDGKEEEDTRISHIAELVKAFWKAVHIDDSTHPPTATPITPPGQNIPDNKTHSHSLKYV